MCPGGGGLDARARERVSHERSNRLRAHKAADGRFAKRRDGWRCAVVRAACARRSPRRQLGVKAARSAFFRNHQETDYVAVEFSPVVRTYYCPGAVGADTTFTQDA